MKRLLLYLVLGLQLTGLCGLYAYYRAGLHYPTIMLQTQRVDPRDLLRGDYIILRYRISDIPEAWSKEHPLSHWEGKLVYVVLKENPEGFAEIDHLQSHRPYDGSTFLLARIEGGRLTYDMEKLFVPEGMGTPTGTLTVEAAVRPDGQPQIKQVFLDGKPYP